MGKRRTKKPSSKKRRKPKLECVCCFDSRVRYAAKHYQLCGDCWELTQCAPQKVQDGIDEASRIRRSQ